MAIGDFFCWRSRIIFWYHIEIYHKDIHLWWSRWCWHGLFCCDILWKNYRVSHKKRSYQYSPPSNTHTPSRRVNSDGALSMHIELWVFHDPTGKDFAHIPEFAAHRVPTWWFQLRTHTSCPSRRNLIYLHMEKIWWSWWPGVEQSMHDSHRSQCLFPEWIFQIC